MACDSVSRSRMPDRDFLGDVVTAHIAFEIHSDECMDAIIDNGPTVIGRERHDDEQ